MIYVLCYPKLDTGVAERISRFRCLHEPERARFVPPHISLVFGLKSIDAPGFVAFCEGVAKCTATIRFEFNAFEIVFDPFEGVHKLFIMASAGKDAITELHERLYEGPQRSQLDHSIPYRPHMTVATNNDRAILERLDPTVIGPMPIVGIVNSLHVVQVADKALRPLRVLPFRA